MRGAPRGRRCPLHPRTPSRSASPAPPRPPLASPRARGYTAAVAHAVIAGAGPAGASLAYLLARRGLGVTLLARPPDSARERRGEGLMPSGAQARGAMARGAARD